MTAAEVAMAPCPCAAPELSVPLEVVAPGLRDEAAAAGNRKRRRIQSCAEEGAGSGLVMRGLALIAKVPLFANVEASEHPRLVGAFTSVEHEPGEVIVRQGEPSSALLICECGKAALKVIGPPNHWASRSPVQVGVMSSGDALGEDALLHDGQWSYTVQALDTVRIWSLERAEFERLGLRHKLRFKRRMAANDFSSMHDNWDAYKRRGSGELDATPSKSDAERAFLRKALLANPHLGPLLRHHSEVELDKVTHRAERRQVKGGIEVVRQGDRNVDHFYIVEEGIFLVINKDRELVDQLGPGGSFGARVLLYREPRFFTVRSSSDATLWQLRREDFRGIERAQLQQKLKDSVAILSRMTVLKSASSYEIQQLADALVEVAFHRGESIIRQGEEGSAVYILYQGAVNVEVKRDAGLEISRKVAESEKGQAEFFGEEALQGDFRSPGSIVAASESVVALVLEREVFQRVMRPAETAPTGVFCRSCKTPLHLPSRICPTCETAPALGIRSSVALKDNEASRVYSRSELEEVGLLGCGRFARVSLVKCAGTGQSFALKTVPKELIMERKQEQNVMVEKMILKTTCSPFLIRVIATFNSEDHLHFLLEAALGGDLLTLYERIDKFGSAEHARFYVACVLRGLEHLHERFIIYRDLKMENLMLDASGYIKLTDFGLSKFVIGHTYTKCGTPDYMAPEIVKGGGHTSAVDWWALGVLTYALMEGSLPFDAQQPCLIFWKVERGIEHASFTDEKATWADLVRGLCKQEPRDRLPVRAGGARGVSEHAWFTDANFNWSALDRQEMPAPSKPPLNGPFDLQNFDSIGQDTPKAGKSYEDPGTGWDADFEDPCGPVSLSPF
eukprot:CAMPEP_0180459290 /NCGR_PEP_ID=MMETSP1036_2-20121128/22777_1 /TAXON_ID=632150 /ORGANISM="Azadinium spinosum, Strain 3D9" /LENGTH=848 /DNA_ID=CAMNT_0022465955 /DNA_START=1 /DNA_END=2547 /DNA_ORIENTATION=-